MFCSMHASKLCCGSCVSFVVSFLHDHRVAFVGISEPHKRLRCSNTLIEQSGCVFKQFYALCCM